MKDDQEEWELAAQRLESLTVGKGSTGSKSSSAAVGGQDMQTNPLKGLGPGAIPGTVKSSDFYSPQISSRGPSTGEVGVLARPTATAAAAVASRHHDVPFDPVLVDALDNPRERIQLLKYEDEILQLVRSKSESEKQFPPSSSYHRLIIHRLAQRFGVEYQTLAATTYDGTGNRAVSIRKVAGSSIPQVLCIDLSKEKRKEAESQNPTPRILLKKRGGAKRAGEKTDLEKDRGASAEQDAKTVEDREREYAEARARIFGESEGANDGGGGESSVASSYGGSSGNKSQSSNSGNSTNNSSGSSFGGGLQAQGPDGSVGFGRGRGSVDQQGQGRDKSQSGVVGSEGRGHKDARNIQSQQEPSGGEGTSPVVNRNSNRKSGGDRRRTNTRGRRSDQNQDAGKWKESKVTWRNRQAEMNDPDFARNYEMYRPNFSPYRQVGGEPNAYIPNQPYVAPYGQAGPVDPLAVGGHMPSGSYYGAPGQEYLPYGAPMGYSPRDADYVYREAPGRPSNMPGYGRGYEAPYPATYDPMGRQSGLPEFVQYNSYSRHHQSYAEGGQFGSIGQQRGSGQDFGRQRQSRDPRYAPNRNSQGNAVVVDNDSYTSNFPALGGK